MSEPLSESLQLVHVGLQNSPLCDLCDDPPLLQGHVLQRSPHQQGHRGHVGDGGRHHQPVRGLIPPPHDAYDPGEPLHDHEDGHDQSGELQPLVQEQLDRLPRQHGRRAAGDDHHRQRPEAAAAGLCSLSLLTLQPQSFYCWVMKKSRWSFYEPRNERHPIISEREQSLSMEPDRTFTIKHRLITKMSKFSV